MKQAFIMIKKIFSIVLSFIFGIFYKKERGESNFLKQSKEKKEKGKVSKNLKQYQINQEEQPSTNKRERQDYYLTKDLEKLYYALQKIQRIESQLKTTTDEITLKTIKEEIEIIKQDLNFLDDKYRKVDSNQGDIKSLTNKLYICNRLIETIEKKIEKISASKKEKLSTGNIEMKGKEELSNPKKTEKKINQKQIEEEKELFEINEDQILSDVEDRERGKEKDSNKDTREKSPVIEIEFPSSGHSKIDNNILDNIIIKDIPKNLAESREIYNINNNQKKDNRKEEVPHVREDELNRQDKSISKETRKKKPKIIKQAQNNGVKKYSVNLSLLKKKVSMLKNYSRIGMISSLVKKALNCTLLIGMGITLRKYPSQFLEQHLMVNNFIRKARRISNKKVKPLPYRKILKSESNLKKQTSYIMTDTLRQIQLLRTEIYSQYGLTEETRKILDELNEIELEVRTSLEQTSQKEEERSKFR
ncbi:MAG: hypothetical protein HFJ12_05875 [Bacilli bacterium]|nr:hypothetical protein [Bacilli bacterium]